ncbi:hypothetical protein ACFL5Q_04845 [Planctomycetota bacterium]
MWRALFLAIGIYLILLGGQCLGVQKIVLKRREPVVQPPQQTFFFGPKEPGVGPLKEIVPPPWAPWSLMAGGAVVCLYSFSIPSRLGKS